MWWHVVVKYGRLTRHHKYVECDTAPAEDVVESGIVKGPYKTLEEATGLERYCDFVGGTFIDRPAKDPVYKAKYVPLAAYIESPQVSVLRKDPT